MAATIAVAVSLSAFGLVGALWGFQERLIYPAPHYAERVLEGLPADLVALTDPQNPLSVVGFYRPSLRGGVPLKLWVVFGGNGDLALHWDPLLRSSATDDTGFLMVEYPGYGARAGEPTPASLLAATEVTLDVLASRLGATAPALETHVSVLGYSIGSAAALQYAARHPVRRIILLAPFTTMLDMARRSVGSPLCYLLSHRYDNVAALRAIQAQGMPPLTILHGDRDAFIPYEMGQALAAHAAGSHFELVPGADHVDVVELAQPRLRELLAEPWPRAGPQ